MVRLVLLPVDIDRDLDQIVSDMFLTFSGEDYCEALFGLDTPANRAMTKQRFLQEFKEDPTILWIKIVDQDNNSRLVTTAQWMVKPNYIERQHSPYNEDELQHQTVEEQLSRGIVNGMKIEWWPEGSLQQIAAANILYNTSQRKRRHVNHPHIFLNLLFTHPDYQHKGAGRMMMQWGTQLADQLFLPAWIEASTRGQPLYSKFGFEIIENPTVRGADWTCPYFLMYRPQETAAPARTRSKQVEMAAAPENIEQDVKEKTNNVPSVITKGVKV